MPRNHILLYPIPLLLPYLSPPDPSAHCFRVLRLCLRKGKRLHQIIQISAELRLQNAAFAENCRKCRRTRPSQRAAPLLNLHKGLFGNSKHRRHFFLRKSIFLPHRLQCTVQCCGKFLFRHAPSSLLIAATDTSGTVPSVSPSPTRFSFSFLPLIKFPSRRILYGRNKSVPLPELRQPLQIKMPPHRENQVV